MSRRGGRGRGGSTRTADRNDYAHANITTTGAIGDHSPPRDGVPRDHLAPRSAREREAQGIEMVRITWDGLLFDVPADPDNWSLWKVSAPLQGGNIAGAVMGLLGPEQSLMLNRARPDMVNGDLTDLWNTIARETGFSTGKNSQRSSR